jgi:hypothetical protein
LNQPIVWLDEIVFSKLAMAKRTWSRRSVHYTTNFEDYYTSYRCAIVAVNSSLGLINYKIYDSAVDEEVFLQYIPLLSDAMGGCPFYLFMD